MSLVNSNPTADMKMAKKLKQGSPLQSLEKLVCVYGPSGSGKTTEIMKYITENNKSAIYLDLDGNTAPIASAPQEILDKMNYIKLRNSLSNMHVATFLNSAMTKPLVEVCQNHGYMNCGLCAKSHDDVIVVNFDTWKQYDLVVVDSVTIMIKAIKLFSIKQAEEDGERNPHAIWQRVSLIATTMMHFLRECHKNVIVLSHPIDVRHEFQKVVQKQGQRKGLALVDAYYMPCFGSVPFSREAVQNLSATIYQTEDGKIITNDKKPYFANARQQIQSTTVSGALKEILG